VREQFCDIIAARATQIERCDDVGIDKDHELRPSFTAPCDGRFDIFRGRFESAA
jgi:hypothetical protein